MWAALAILAGMAALLAIALGLSIKRLPYRHEPVSDHIDRLLPQTQCRQCGYDGCHPYADAIARGEASINRCPPGGARTIRALAALLNRDVSPLAADVGKERPPAVAVIDESTCIGCTLCAQVRPVDAIAFRPHEKHEIDDDKCTRCGMCMQACKDDAIRVGSGTTQNVPSTP